MDSGESDSRGEQVELEDEETGMMTAGSEGILTEARDRERDRIRADLEKAETEDVRQVLRFIQGHLFDAGFNINVIQRELNPKRQTFRRFQAQVGDSPKRYTDHCKRRTAGCRAVEDCGSSRICDGIQLRPSFQGMDRKAAGSVSRRGLQDTYPAGRRRRGNIKALVSSWRRCPRGCRA